MERWARKVAVITGASSGIGAGVAERLVKEGLIVVGIARRQEKVEELATKLKAEKGKLYAVKADVRKEEEILEAFKWIKDNVGPIHILVNSAGIFRTSSLIDGDTKMWKDVLDVNVSALCITSREAIKDMKGNNVDGHIVHINSIGGHRPVPGGNISSSSKYCVTALTETLRQELNAMGSKIKVSSVSPGFVRTGIFEATFQASNLPVPEDLKDYVEHGPVLQVEDMADAIVYVLGTPPHVQVHELTILPLGGRTV